MQQLRQERVGGGAANGGARVGRGHPLSWMALVAGTALGGETVLTVAAEVHGEIMAKSGSGRDWRLVVQAYPRQTVVHAGVPAGNARPSGAAQRSVSPMELRKGVAVEILQIGAQLACSENVLVAWVEPGAADLTFDALGARPGPDAVVAGQAAEPVAAKGRLAVRARGA